MATDEGFHAPGISSWKSDVWNREKAAKGDLILQVALVVRRRIRKEIGLRGEGCNIKKEMSNKSG